MEQDLIYNTQQHEFTLSIFSMHDFLLGCIRLLINAEQVLPHNISATLLWKSRGVNITAHDSKREIVLTNVDDNHAPRRSRLQGSF